MFCYGFHNQVITLKLKPWILYLFSTTCFIIVSVINLTEKKYSMAILFLVLSTVYLFLSFTTYKYNKKFGAKSLSNEDLEKLNTELKILIAQNKKNKAIKKYREVTGLGLQEAYDYVNSLSEEDLA